jgi:hypothetical protein
MPVHRLFSDSGFSVEILSPPRNAPAQILMHSLGMKSDYAQKSYILLKAEIPAANAE